MWQYGWPVRLCFALLPACKLCLWTRAWINLALGRNTTLKTAWKWRIIDILPEGYGKKKPTRKGWV